MSELSVRGVNEDLSLLVNSLSDSDKLIPSFVEIAKRSMVIPCFSIALSFIGVVNFYLSLMAERAISLSNFRVFFWEEGWYPVAASVVVGLLFFIMSYTNLTLYMTIPSDIRNKSLVMKHIRGLIKKTILIFISLICLVTVFTGVVPALTFAVPGITFVFLFAINIVVSVEVNRLGMGPMMEKISKLIKKI
ncbi:hypothetical protein SJI19_19565 [Acerihabitans sp. TG2]|uniref:hypothetical protein n=1 Tax=Acerihabitans sp. TG2 TaxID=3096008 RepID=UPI002B239456|nr:hypothetical protein [Acerihabitans sp. TG2]MEA9392707.1 hypothetical protein [Acerihabitans sp. TG2]